MKYEVNNDRYECYKKGASKYAALLEEKDRELGRLTAEAEQSLLLYNNMVATIVKRDGEIERLKETLKKVRKECPDGSWFAKTIDKALNTHNNQAAK